MRRDGDIAPYHKLLFGCPLGKVGQFVLKPPQRKTLLLCLCGERARTKKNHRDAEDTEKNGEGPLIAGPFFWTRQRPSLPYSITHHAFLSSMPVEDQGYARCVGVGGVLREEDPAAWGNRSHAGSLERVSGTAASAPNPAPAHGQSDEANSATR